MNASAGIVADRYRLERPLDQDGKTKTGVARVIPVVSARGAFFAVKGGF
jgi:hypothetical protein